MAVALPAFVIARERRIIVPAPQDPVMSANRKGENVINRSRLKLKVGKIEKVPEHELGRGILNEFLDTGKNTLEWHRTHLDIHHHVITSLSRELV
jgi:hypothetical protein